MNVRIATVLAAGWLSLIVPATSVADDDPKKPDGGQPAAKDNEKKPETSAVIVTGKAAAEALFKQLDKNADGTITESEVEGERQQRFFQRLVRSGDKNGDKKLTRDEFERGLTDSTADDRAAPARPAAAEGRGFDRTWSIERFDKNGDGKVAADEVPSGAGREFYEQIIARYDTNKDGALDREELAAARGASPAGGGTTPRPGAAIGPARASVGPGLMRVLDIDSDGALSADEIAKATEALKKLDKNGDGKVSGDELPAVAVIEGGRFGGGAATEGFARRLAEADKNGDGKLSKDEAPERIKTLFDRLDRNGDGFIDGEELRAQSDAVRGAGETPRRRPE